MIENTALDNILSTAYDLSWVCEIYDADVVPTADGFDPADALGLFAAVSGDPAELTFLGEPYLQLVTRFGGVKVGTSGEVSSTSVSFSNVTREMANFEFDHGFEGLVMVVRMISRSMSTELAHTKIEFVGRCDKPDSGNKQSITISAKSITGSIDVKIPRRNFGPDDLEGRPASHPEFEGFIYMPTYGSVSWVRREKKGGFLGWWNKKWVRHTLNYSSYSNLDANKPVPECLGANQMLGVLISAVDAGTTIKMRHAWVEGEIDGFLNVRSTDYTLPVTLVGEMKGKVGVLNVDPDPAWVGPGNYSRTAVTLSSASGTAIDVEDPAPDVAAIIKGRLMKIPNGANVWAGNVWSDDAAAHVRFLYTSSHYYNLAEAWIDDNEFGNCFWFHNELIFNSEVSDFTFVNAG